MSDFKVGNTIVTEQPLVTLEKAVFDDLVAALQLIASGLHTAEGDEHIARAALAKVQA